MLYFLAAPKFYRKMLFISKTKKLGIRNHETLAERYVRTYGHLIPGDVEVFELDEERPRSHTSLAASIDISRSGRTTTT